MNRLISQTISVNPTSLLRPPPGRLLCVMNRHAPWSAHTLNCTQCPPTTLVHPSQPTARQGIHMSPNTYLSYIHGGRPFIQHPSCMCPNRSNHSTSNVQPFSRLSRLDHSHCSYYVIFFFIPATVLPHPFSY